MPYREKDTVKLLLQLADAADELTSKTHGDFHRRIAGEIKDLQQRLALKDLEIKRLREAFEKVKDISKKTQFYVYISQVCDNLLSTPTTYDDLLAWHNEQLGKPVAEVRWRNGEMITKFMIDFVEAGTKLYAKKG